MARARRSDATLAALKWLAVGLIIAYVGSLYAEQFDWQPPFSTYVVQSGSMEPAIMTGDLILIRPSLSYDRHQVITFRDAKDRVITHRIVDIISGADGISFATKGDANPAGDSQLVAGEQIMGRVVLTVPKLGYLVSWGKTRWGSLFLVVIPAVLIIYDEYRDIKRRLS